MSCSCKSQLRPFAANTELPVMKFSITQLVLLALLTLGLLGCDLQPTTPTAPDVEAPAAQVEPAAPKRSRDASDVLFEAGTIPQLRIEIAPPELQKLRENQRAYVRCTIRESKDVVYKGVGIKLKGAAGSFREIDDRPALTLNMDKFAKKQSFHDLTKLHLNNSVQDESYLNELLCSELSLSAGVPAARTTHARVWLNERDLGLYVLKEGFDKKFLKRHFSDATGNLYDGGFVQDVDAELEKDSGNGDDDRSDLHALKDACAEAELDARWARVAERLDVDRFTTFMAIELMMGHWDGYVWNKNNYRIYFDPKTQQAHFFPHGMDQMFGDPGFPVLEHPGSIVGSTVMQNPQWRARYRERLRELLPNFAPADKLLARVEAVQKRLRPLIAEFGADRAAAFDDRVREVRERLIARAENLQQQVNHEEPSPLGFDEHGFADLPDWYGASDCEDAMHEEVELPGDPPLPAYSIQCGPSGRCIASWRRKVLLANGRYRFVARLKTKDVDPLADDRGAAVGLRISGAARTNKLAGSRDWTPLQFEFQVAENVREVELVAEIRATKGQLWLDRASLKLERLSEAE